MHRTHFPPPFGSPTSSCRKYGHAAGKQKSPSLPIGGAAGTTGNWTIKCRADAGAIGDELAIFAEFSGKKLTNPLYTGRLHMGISVSPDSTEFGHLTGA